MRLHELITELQKYQMPDAILVANDRKVLGKPIITKHGSEGSRDLFFSLSFESVPYGEYTEEQIPQELGTSVDSLNRAPIGAKFLRDHNNYVPKDED